MTPFTPSMPIISEQSLTPSNGPSKTLRSARVSTRLHDLFRRSFALPATWMPFLSASIQQSFDLLRSVSRPLTVLWFQCPEQRETKGVKVLSWHKGAWKGLNVTESSLIMVTGSSNKEKEAALLWSQLRLSDPPPGLQWAPDVRADCGVTPTNLHAHKLCLSTETQQRRISPSKRPKDVYLFLSKTDLCCIKTVSVVCFVCLMKQCGIHYQHTSTHTQIYQALVMLVWAYSHQLKNMPQFDKYSFSQRMFYRREPLDGHIHIDVSWITAKNSILRARKTHFKAPTAKHAKSIIWKFWLSSGLSFLHNAFL